MRGVCQRARRWIGRESWTWRSRGWGPAPHGTPWAAASMPRGSLTSRAGFPSAAFSAGESVVARHRRFASWAGSTARLGRDAVDAAAPRAFHLAVARRGARDDAPVADGGSAVVDVVAAVRAIGPTRGCTGGRALAGDVAMVAASDGAPGPAHAPEHASIPARRVAAARKVGARRRAHQSVAAVEAGVAPALRAHAGARRAAAWHVHGTFLGAREERADQRSRDDEVGPARCH